MFGRLTKKLMKYRSYNRVLDFIIYNFALENVSYSQNCEDIIIQELLGKDKGVYVDVGAHHPYMYSNTYKMYIRGWSGINIDPFSDHMKLFEKYRPDDINLNVGISKEEGQITYYSFEEPAYNTISEKRANELLEKGITKLREKSKIQTVPLRKVFEKYLGEHDIDVLNIDVETMELDVLMSNDWNKYKPKLIVMESIVSCNESVEKLNEDKAIDFLLNLNYIVIAKVMNAVFLILKDNNDKA